MFSRFPWYFREDKGKAGQGKSAKHGLTCYSAEVVEAPAKISYKLARMGGPRFTFKAARICTTLEERNCVHWRSCQIISRALAKGVSRNLRGCADLFLKTNQKKSEQNQNKSGYSRKQETQIGRKQGNRNKLGGYPSGDPQNAGSEPAPQTQQKVLIVVLQFELCHWRPFVQHSLHAGMPN